MFISKFSIVTGFAFAATLLFGGCTTAKYAAFEPKPAQGASNPEAYASYGRAMAPNKEYKMAYEWQRANPKLVKEAVKTDVLAAFLESPAAADALLAKIGTSYDGDPVVLTQIAAVTQLVMAPYAECSRACSGNSATSCCGKKGNIYSSPKFRNLWVAALKRARAKTDDGYVKVFCDQQLRICE